MFRLLKKIFVVLIGFFLLLTSAGSTLAQTKPSISPTPVAEINSFEFFWPLAPGKTQGESLYNLKRLKENVRGWLIFSPIKKADYLVFLATKRVLETEKLAKDGKLDLAKKTMDQAASDIEKSDASLVKSIQTGEQGGPTRSSLAEKLNKLETFLKWYADDQPDLKTETDSLLGKIMVESGKL